MAQEGVKRLHKPISRASVWCDHCASGLTTYKKKVSIHWPSYCRSEQKIFSSKSDFNVNIFSSSSLTHSIITFEVKKVTVIYMTVYMCMISPRSISLPSSIIWFIICADINHGFGSVRGQHGANPGLWLVNKGDRMCLHLMGLGSPSRGEERSSGIPNCFSLQKGLWTFAVGPLAHKLTLQKITINHDNSEITCKCHILIKGRLLFSLLKSDLRNSPWYWIN